MIARAPRLLILLTMLMGLAACSTKDIPFTDYLVENLLRDNLQSLIEPPFFEVAEIEILETESDNNTASAKVNVSLFFPRSFSEVIEQRGIAADSQEYQRYRGSFGEFAAGETQIHHARYAFQRRQGKWFIVGSQPVAAPEIRRRK